MLGKKCQKLFCNENLQYLKTDIQEVNHLMLFIHAVDEQFFGVTVFAHQLWNTFQIVSMFYWWIKISRSPGYCQGGPVSIDYFVERYSNATNHMAIVLYKNLLVHWHSVIFHEGYTLAKWNLPLVRMISDKNKHTAIKSMLQAWKQIMTLS